MKIKNLALTVTMAASLFAGSVAFAAGGSALRYLVDQGQLTAFLKKSGKLNAANVKPGAVQPDLSVLTGGSNLSLMSEKKAIGVIKSSVESLNVISPEDLSAKRTILAMAEKDLDEVKYNEVIAMLNAVKRLALSDSVKSSKKTASQCSSCDNVMLEGEHLKHLKKSRQVKRAYKKIPRTTEELTPFINKLAAEYGIKGSIAQAGDHIIKGSGSNVGDLYAVALFLYLGKNGSDLDQKFVKNVFDSMGGAENFFTPAEDVMFFKAFLEVYTTALEGGQSHKTLMEGWNSLVERTNELVQKRGMSVDEAFARALRSKAGKDGQKDADYVVHNKCYVK